MDKKKFAQLAKQGYNLIPLVKTLAADLETPLTTYLKLTNCATNTFLLESFEGGEKWGRYSFIGLAAEESLEISGKQARIIKNGKTVEKHTTSKPYDFIRQYRQRFKLPPTAADSPRFMGGLVGYFSYDCVRYSEKKLATSQPLDDLKIPDINLLLCREFAVFDNLRAELLLVHLADPNTQTWEAVRHRLDELNQQLSQPLAEKYRNSIFNPKPQTSPYQANFSQQDYKNAVNKIKDYVVAGDVMQVVPSQRMQFDFKHKSAINLYRALRQINPSPYMYHLNLKSVEIVGSSPEILARLDKEKITLRPLAGSRPRGENSAADQQLEHDLLNDSKEIAEHVMLIDLGRNDLGKIAEIGSVKVKEKMTIERYSHVMHISSHINAVLQKNKDALHVLAATLPAGTLSGAPKVRAMQIIDEIEPVKRGIYGGCVGYIDFNNNMDMAIAIRTAVITGQKLYLQGGGGIVANSQPEQEWQETINKRQAMLKALNSIL